MKKLGLFGGTFNPIHNGHIVIAEKAYTQFGLDKVWFMPSPTPPHKDKGNIISYEHRVAMVKLAIEDYEGFECSEFEKKYEGKSYSAQTLTELTELYPDTEICFIIGADSFYEIERWYHPEIVMKLAHLLVAVRNYDGADKTMEAQKKLLEQKYGARISFIESDLIDISSTEIREAIKAGHDISKMIPVKVFEYIKANHIYE